MLQHFTSLVNSSLPNFPVQLHDIKFTKTEETWDFSQIRLNPIPYRLLCEVHAIQKVYKHDYGYTPKEIVDRWLLKEPPVNTSVRSIERAWSVLKLEGLIEDVDRLGPPVWGKEKFRGKYRGITNKGIAFIKSKEQEKAAIRLKSLKSIPEKHVFDRLAELMAELNGSLTYSPVVSQSVYSIQKDCIDTTNQSSSYNAKSSSRDVFNQCFEEYEQALSKPKPKPQFEPIYNQVLPKYKDKAKLAIDASGLLIKAKERVIEQIVAYQQKGKEITNPTGFVNNLINIEKEAARIANKPSIVGLQNFSNGQLPEVFSEKESEERKERAANMMLKVKANLKND